MAKKYPYSKKTREPRSEKAVQPTLPATTWVHCRITATLLQDAHLGSGTGGAGIDAMVARDREGRPVLWASHLEGLLRDVARAMGDAALEGRFFGQRGGLRQEIIFSSLYFEPSPVIPDGGPYTRVWRSTRRISEENRAPMPDTLRAIEYVRSGTRFSGYVELRDADVAPLRRLLNEVTAVGSGRAPGAGRVRFHLEPVPAPGNAPAIISGGRTCLRFLITNLDPLCLADTANPDNLIRTHTFVHGRSIAGALAAWLHQEGRVDAARMLVSGAVTVGDALPLPPQKELTVTDLHSLEVSPAPLALKHRKPTETNLIGPWWSADAREQDHVDGFDKAGDVKLKRPSRSLFVARATSDAVWVPYEVSVLSRLRNGRSKPEQVRGAKEPDLFAVEGIPERTRFLVQLDAKDPADIEIVAAALREVLSARRWLRIGRGGTPVAVVQSPAPAYAGPATHVDPAFAPRPEPRGTDAHGASKQAMYLTLTSDLLARDDQLRWLGRLDAACLEELAGATARTITIADSVQEEALVHGFNGTARLWRLPATAIRRGSVFMLSGDGIWKLKERLARGEWLGERTEQGFGRFRLDATLPGVSKRKSESVGIEWPGAVDDEIAGTAMAWCKNLLQAKGDSRVPSSSQWRDFLAAVRANPPTAIADRLSSTTVGGAAWRGAGAQAILQALSERYAAADSGDPKGAVRNDPVRHLEMFIRFWRLEEKKRKQQVGPPVGTPQTQVPGGEVR